MGDSNVVDQIKRMLQALSAKKDDIAVVIVANMKGKTQSEDYTHFSVTTDYFSETEMEELISGFRDFGFYVDVFTDEMEFIKFVANERMAEIPRPMKIVYGTAQKGIGAARQSLVPAFCKLYRIPIIGSNGYVASLCRHKFHFNALLRRYAVALPQTWLFDSKAGWLLGETPPRGTKIIQKPIYEAASIGITKSSVFNYSEKMEKDIREASLQFGQPVVLEEFISGYEIEVPLLIDLPIVHALGPVGIALGEELRIGDKILSYEDVYDDSYSFYNFQELGAITNNEILKFIAECTQILGIEDYGRIDLRVTSDGKFYLTDVTTNPHIVRHSSCNFIFGSMGFSHAELLATIVAAATRRYGWI